jgi:hypothetical protein
MWLRSFGVGTSIEDVAPELECRHEYIQSWSVGRSIEDVAQELGV